MKTAIDPNSVVRIAVAEIERAAVDYEIGNLQAIRTSLRGLKRMPGRRIFSNSTTFNEWAWHNGGRREMQFNIGLDQYPDGSLALRAGVAFSLERTQSLKDWRILVPRIARFNDFMREHPETYADLDMWHTVRERRSQDRAAGPIDTKIVADKTFIFMGNRQPIDAVNVHECLRVFDRLLEIFRHVQTGPDILPPEGLSSIAGGGLSGGVASKTLQYITAHYAERTLNIYLRHNELQNLLKTKLSTFGRSGTILERRLGQYAIDLVYEEGDELWFYEVKTAGTARQCLREAIGQLLEYALWPGSPRPTKLIVVGESAPDQDTDVYLKALNGKFPVALEYLCLKLDDASA